LRQQAGAEPDTDACPGQQGPEPAPNGKEGAAREPLPKIGGQRRDQDQDDGDLEPQENGEQSHGYGGQPEADDPLHETREEKDRRDQGEGFQLQGVRHHPSLWHGSS
jgi:hypothetical protein